MVIYDFSPLFFIFLSSFLVQRPRVVTAVFAFLQIFRDGNLLSRVSLLRRSIFRKTAA